MDVELDPDYKTGFCQTCQLSVDPRRKCDIREEVIPVTDVRHPFYEA